MLMAFICGGFGLIVGSFLNVLIIRHGVRSVGGRSACMSCGRQLVWSDMIPVLSWILLGGRCRKCKAHISAQYPLVEAATGILFAFLGAWAASEGYTALPLLLLYLGIAALQVAIAVYDLRHTIIPDEWAYTFAALAFIAQFLTPLPHEFSLLWMLLAGPLAAFPLFSFWFLSRGTWMGLGDAKLALGIGWLLGPVNGVFAVFFAFIIGAGISVPLLFMSSDRGRRFFAVFTPSRTSQKSRGGFTMKSEIPFGPFLIISCIIVWLLRINGIDLPSTFGLLPW